MLLVIMKLSDQKISLSQKLLYLRNKFAEVAMTVFLIDRLEKLRIF